MESMRAKEVDEAIADLDEALVGGDLADLEPTPYEVQEAEHARQRKLNTAREIRRLLQANRDAGHPPPRPGDKFYVTTARGLLRRTRSGLRFESARTMVEVRDQTEAEIYKLQQSGRYVVSVLGAEKILEDSGPLGGLTVYRSSAAADRNERVAELETQLAQAQKDLADAIAARAAEARRNAPPSTDGRPNRLNAARAAAQAAADTLPDPQPPELGKD